MSKHADRFLDEHVAHDWRLLGLTRHTSQERVLLECSCGNYLGWLPVEVVTPESASLLRMRMRLEWLKGVVDDDDVPMRELMLADPLEA